MTREEARKKAEVMMAYADGKNIESRIKGEDEFNLCLGEVPFNFNCYEYRIKEEPTYRPFKDKEECWNEMMKHQPLGWLRGKYSKGYENLLGIGDNKVYGKYVDVTFKVAYNSYTFADGTPFGIKKEE